MKLRGLTGSSFFSRILYFLNVKKYFEIKNIRWFSKTTQRIYQQKCMHMQACTRMFKVAPYHLETAQTYMLSHLLPVLSSSIRVLNMFSEQHTVENLSSKVCFKNSKDISQVIK